MFKYKLSSLALAGATALALTAAAPAPAQASALHLMPAFGAASVDSNVVQVQRRWRHRGHRHRGHWHRGWGHRDRDAWLALGIGSAIVGGMIAAQGSAPYATASSAWEQCAAQFQSLREDGTYTTYDGRQVLCPYLR